MERTVARGESVWWIGHGAAAGILAGVLFIMFQMLIAAFQTGGQGFFLPLRAASTLIAGPSAMQPEYPLLRAAVTGIAAHLALAALGGMLLGLIAGLAPRVAVSGAGLIGLGAIYGLVLWLTAGFGLATEGWARFFQLSDPLVQLTAYTCFFGAALGAYLAFVRPRRSDTPDWMLDARSHYARSRARRAA